MEMPCTQCKRIQDECVCTNEELPRPLFTRVATELRPTNQEIQRFLEIFKKLNDFEATQRHIRGYGAFLPGEIPSPETIKVLKWLNDLTISEIKVNIDPTLKLDEAYLQNESGQRVYIKNLKESDHICEPFHYDGDVFEHCRKCGKNLGFAAKESK